MKLLKNTLFKRIKSFALDRKGLGMELAMMVLLVAVGCSMLLVSFAMWGRDALLQKEQKVMQRLAIDSFVENELADGDVDIEEKFYNEGTFVCIKNGNSFNIEKVEPGDAERKNVVLEFEIKYSTITSWKYH